MELRDFLFSFFFFFPKWSRDTTVGEEAVGTRVIRTSKMYKPHGVFKSNTGNRNEYFMCVSRKVFLGGTGNIAGHQRSVSFVRP